MKNMSQRYFLFIFFLLNNVNFSMPVKKVSNYFVRKETKFKTEFVLEEIETSSCSICLSKCDVTSECISASWNGNEKQCLLSKYDQIQDPWNVPTPPTLVTSIEWKTYSRIVYPVFHVRSPGARYTMTFSAAKEACKERGGTLASPSDLLTARSLGFGSCNCGWLTNQNKGLVLQEKNPVCIDGFTTGIMYCNWLSTANAWCTFV